MMYVAVVRHARVSAGETVVVFGCGGVGLNVIQSARLVGAGRIIAVDPSERKLAWARDFGATDLLTSDDDTIETIRDVTGGRGADCAFEAVGSPEPLICAIESCRNGGQVVLLGAGGSNVTMTIPYNLFRGDKRITRLTYGQGRPAIDFPRIVRLYLDGRYMLDELITMRLPLAQINEGFEAMLNGELIRAIVTF